MKRKIIGKINLKKTLIEKEYHKIAEKCRKKEKIEEIENKK